jgi:hypothetical protein
MQKESGPRTTPFLIPPSAKGKEDDAKSSGFKVLTSRFSFLKKKKKRKKKRKVRKGEKKK